MIRRNHLEQQGLEFDNRRDPQRILLIFDIPEAIYNAGHVNAYNLIQNHLGYAIILGFRTNPTTEPDDRTVRLVLTYHLSDADNLLPFDEQTPEFIFKRVSALIEERRHNDWRDVPCDIAYRQRGSPCQPMTIQRFDVWEATRYH